MVDSSMLSVARNNIVKSRKITEYCISNNMLRSSNDVLCRSVSEFAWKYWIKSQITSNKVVGISTEVRIWHLPKVNQKIWCLSISVLNNIKNRHVLTHLLGLFQDVSRFIFNT